MGAQGWITITHPVKRQHALRVAHGANDSAIHCKPLLLQPMCRQQPGGEVKEAGLVEVATGGVSGGALLIQPARQGSSSKGSTSHE
jgi:hypothetical protein